MAVLFPVVIIKVIVEGNDYLKVSVHKDGIRKSEVFKMTKITKGMAAIAITLFASMILIMFGAGDTFAASIIPVASNNTNVGGVSNSGIAKTANGYVRVFCDSEKVYAEDYDDSFNITARRSIPMELNMYGGFYSGSNAYYLVFGQLNEKEDNNAEVIRVVKYDKNWNRISAANLKGDSAFGHQVRIPFDAGNLNMAEYGGMLYIVTGHEGYVDEQFGQGHQGFLMYKVNESTMQGEIVDADLWHSFAQHIAIKDQNNIYTVEESEGSRYTQLTKRTTSNYNGNDISVLDYGGSRTSAWAIPTYASVDGIALSDNNVLTVGSSIDQSRYDDESYTKEYRIYLTKTPMNNFSKEATSFKWFTSKKTQERYNGIKITKVNVVFFTTTY